MPITSAGAPYYKAIVTAENIQATSIGNDRPGDGWGREVYLAYTLVGVRGGPQNPQLAVIGGALSQVATQVHKDSLWTPQSHRGGPMKVEAWVPKDYDFVLVNAALFELDNAKNFQEMADQPYFTEITSPSAFDWKALGEIIKGVDFNDPKKLLQALWKAALQIAKFVSQDDPIGGKQGIQISPKPGEAFQGGPRALAFRGGLHGNFDVKLDVKVQA